MFIDWFPPLQKTYLMFLSIVYRINTRDRKTIWQAAFCTREFNHKTSFMTINSIWIVLMIYLINSQSYGFTAINKTKIFIFMHNRFIASDMIILGGCGCRCGFECRKDRFHIYLTLNKQYWHLRKAWAFSAIESLPLS